MIKMPGTGICIFSWLKDEAEALGCLTSWWGQFRWAQGKVMLTVARRLKVCEGNKGWSQGRYECTKVKGGLRIAVLSQSSQVKMTRVWALPGGYYFLNYILLHLDLELEGAMVDGTKLSWSGGNAWFMSFLTPLLPRHLLLRGNLQKARCPEGRHLVTTLHGP